MEAPETANTSVFPTKSAEKPRQPVAPVLMHCSGRVFWAQLADSVQVFGHEYVRNFAERDDCLLLGEM